MKKCAFLSMSSLKNFSVYDQPLIRPLNEAGWKVDHIAWTDNVNWDEYDVVIVRSTWDYFQRIEEFLAVLQSIEDSNAILYNSRNLIEWNMRKTYLRVVGQKGISVIPTMWVKTLDHANIVESFIKYDTNEVVVKPQVGLNALNTFRLRKSDLQNNTVLPSEIKGQSMMIQPLMTSIADGGEYSLVFINGQYSHAVVKRPKSGDFRVQEHLGGRTLKHDPSPASLDFATEVLRALPEKPFYARVDFVKEKGTYLLMEIELIEPSLYYNIVPEAVPLFVKGLEERSASKK